MTTRTFPPTLATTFLGCRQATALELARRDAGLETQLGLSRLTPAGIGDQAQLVIDRGHEHEASVLEAMQKERDVAVIFDGAPDHKSRDADLAATRVAMERGAAVIHQATLRRVPWFGYADFLVRVERPSLFGAWSYEPWDAKLATRAKPSHVLQIALYAHMLEEAQGVAPAAMGLMLGLNADEPDGGGLPGSDSVFRERRFPFADFRFYAQRVARRLIGFVEQAPWGDLDAEPCGACAQCHWLPRCEAAWEAADHLRRTAGLSSQQCERLRAHGVPTQMALAAEPMPAVREDAPSRRHGIGAGTLARLIHQAILQRETMAQPPPEPPNTRVPVTELLPAEPGRGLARLPPPDRGDIFFDFEGDPFEPGGLDYLCGVLVDTRALEGASAAERRDFVTVDGGGAGRSFRAFWAHDREAEGCSFTRLMDFITAHLTRHPQAHLYHYAPYEKTAMRRMASMHALRENEFDDLLRAGRLVDLYAVVREGVRVGARDYSIKSLEPLYMAPRTTDTTGGGDSIVMYHQWRDGGGTEQRLLDDIEAYNRDDCISTVLLRDWLIGQAKRGGVEIAQPAPTAEEEPRERHPSALQADALRETLLTHDAPLARIAADLVHYHQREDKPIWWKWYDRLDARPDDLRDDHETVGGAVADPSLWGEATKTPTGKVAKAKRYRFVAPHQETKLDEGDEVFIAPGPAGPSPLDGRKLGMIEAIETIGTGKGADDRLLVTVRANPTVKVDEVERPLPSALSMIPKGYIPKDNVIAAVHRFADDVANGGGTYPHIEAFLDREPPRFRKREPGRAIVPEGTDGPAATLEATVDAVLALDRSWMVIQGPPGAGKTHTLSRLIEALNAKGKTVGVTSNSHKAVDNVLVKTATHWRAVHGEAAAKKRRGQKKVSNGGDWDGDLFEEVLKYDQLSEDADVIGGTAWCFPHPDCPPVDVLVVDEAGQVSLANLVASATKAKSIVLVGDQMQLPQVVQGAHPGESALSCLEYALQDARVVPPERGVFLRTTWRMHPELTRFVSESIYEGELRSEPGCANQALKPVRGAHPALKPVGLSFVAELHKNRSQHAPEEIERVAALLDDLLRSKVTDREGKTRKMRLSDVLVVAPYNVQVNRLREALPDGARVGTVDKFQGQEAEVVIVSMTTSDAAHMPRDASFLLSRNRLNVAVSRARCLAVVVCSPALLDLDAGSVEEMRLANLLCRTAAEGAIEKENT